MLDPNPVSQVIQVAGKPRGQPRSRQRLGEKYLG